MSPDDIKKNLALLAESYSGLTEKAFHEKFGIKVKSDGKHLLFDYDMLNADWDYEPTYLCRGLVLDAESFEPLCLPLTKFWNAAEGLATVIDWDSSLVFEKLDGTMVARWYSPHTGQFEYTTRRQLPGDIKTNTLQGTIYTWDKIISKCMENVLPDIAQKETETMVFEIMSPANRVVVQHKNFSAKLLAHRDNETCKEFSVYNHKHSPKTFAFASTEECAEFADSLNGLEGEGFVVVDAGFNRVKIKGKDYLALHHLKDSAGNSLKSLILVVKNGELSEVGAAFPEFIPAMEAIAGLIADWILFHIRLYEELKDIPEQKQFALALMDKKPTNPGLLFSVRAGKADSITEAIIQMDDHQFIRTIKPLAEKAGISVFSIEE
jgi:hypothetical protein